MESNKKCSDCKRIKATVEFCKNKAKRDGLNNLCIECTKLRARKYKYGVTSTVFENMVTDQCGKCKICDRLLDNKSLVIDHDHVTGRVRGLLCRQCNFVIGFAGDSTKVLLSAVNYLND